MNRQSHIILVTGGQRSGKSENAERLALDLSPTPVYIATCTPMDEEMERRVEIHRKRREGQGWTTIEAPDLDSVPPLPGATVLIDSATMLASNSFLEYREDDNAALAHLSAAFDAFTSRSDGATIIVVTDEIGLGGVSSNALARRFTDLLGLFNRYLAEMASDVYFSVSGIPVKIK